MKENKEAKTGLTTGKEEEQRRQEHKRQGRKTLKRHYWPLILLFVIMVFFGTEYTELSESINNLRPGTTLSDTFDVNAIDEAVADVDAIISETTDTADVPGIQKR